MNSTLSHVALLVSSVDRSAQFLNSQGIVTGESETFESEGTKEIYVGSYDDQCGLLLLLEPIAVGPYERAMKKRGPSLHHIAMDVLDIEKFIPEAERAGWKLHPASAKTMAHKTAYFFLKGVPSLIEATQKKKISSNPLKISKLELPIRKAEEALFDAIGLRGIVISAMGDICLTLDGKKLSFAQIAGPK